VTAAFHFVECGFDTRFPQRGVEQFALIERHGHVIAAVHEQHRRIVGRDVLDRVRQFGLLRRLLDRSANEA